MASYMSGLRGLAELSGSFAVSGLVAATCRPSRTAHAFYVDPALVVFKDVPYPVKKASGTLVTPDGPKVYPVDELLRGPWSPFHPYAMALVFAKNAGIQAAFYLQSYIQQLDRLEEEARERALLEGRDEDEADEVKLPPIPLDDIERLAKAAGRSTIRESTCTHIRRRIELGLHGRVSDRLLWKGLKDVPRSAVRKGHRFRRFWQVGKGTFFTVQRAYLVSQVAEWILSTTLDTLWLLGVPLLPPRWQVRLGAARPERPPAEIARLEQALPGVFPEVAPGGVPPPAQQQERDDQELQDQGPDAQEPGQQQQPGGQRDDVASEPIEENLPALEPIAWGRRLGRVVKRASGNALRVLASLLASSAGAAIAAAIYPAGPLVMIAANAADLALAILLTGPELSDWYHEGKLPLHTMAIAALSLGITILLVDNVAKTSG